MIMYDHSEVELEVTDRLEVALQQLKSVDFLKSFSAPGYSQIWVNIKRRTVFSPVD